MLFDLMNLYELLDKLACELTWDFIFRIINVFVLMAFVVPLVFVQLSGQIEVEKKCERLELYREYCV